MENKASTHSHKIAKVKATNTFVVHSKKDGWINSVGSKVELSASPKATLFFDSEASARAQGFSPSDAQVKALAEK